MSIKKASVFLFMSAQLLLSACAIRMYVGTRLELMEAQKLISWMLVRDTATRERLTDGADIDWAAGRLSTNQCLLARYIMKRNVMQLSQPFAHAFIASQIKRGKLSLDSEGLELFKSYDGRYRKWAGGDHGDFKCRVPIIDQIEWILYNRWDDRMELWQTLKPKNQESTVKLDSPEKSPALLQQSMKREAKE